MIDDIPESQLLRTKVEEALRFFVKDQTILKPGNPAEGEAFLEIPGPKGEAIEFFERDARVELSFGHGVESFNFSGTWGDEDEAAEAVLDSEEESEESAEAEEDIKEELEALVNTTLDIIEESLFSAQYETLSVRMGGLFPAEDFEAMKELKDFESVSWNGTFDRKPAAAV